MDRCVRRSCARSPLVNAASRGSGDGQHTGHQAAHRLRLPHRQQAPRSLPTAAIPQGDASSDRAAPPRLRAGADQGRRGANNTRTSRRRVSRSGGPEDARQVASKDREQPLYNISPYTFEAPRRSRQHRPQPRAYIKASRQGAATSSRSSTSRARSRSSTRPTGSSSSSRSSPTSTCIPTRVSNIEMGYIFEELIRRFNEQANETAGDHFTPREVIRLMVNLLFTGEEDILHGPASSARSTTQPAARAACSPSPRNTSAS